MMPWAPRGLTPQGETLGSSLPVLFSHPFTWKAEHPADRQSPQDAVARILCHVLVGEVPDQGIPDLLETIAEVADFYWQRTRLPPQIEEAPQVRPAELGRAYERPEFHASEE